MTFVLDAAVKVVRDDFVRTIKTKPHGSDTDLLLIVSLPILTGIPHLFRPSKHLGAIRNGTLRIGSPSYTNTVASDEVVFHPNSFNLEDDLVRIARVASCSGRPVTFVRDFQNSGVAELNACLVDVHISLQMERQPSPTNIPVSSALVHDVMSALHGYDRRAAGFVCKAWRLQACDMMLPVTNDDATAWLASRITEVKRAIPDFHPTIRAVVKAWALARHWLGGSFTC